MEQTKHKVFFASLQKSVYFKRVAKNSWPYHWDLMKSQWVAMHRKAWRYCQWLD